jgi:hypothetical protein
MAYANKPKNLSTGTTTALKQWYIETKYLRRKEIEPYAMKKGTVVEQESIELLTKYLEGEVLDKNEIKKSNDYVHGTPDIITETEIIDIKSSYDCFSFHNSFLEPNLDKKYFWQLQGYMWLFDKEIGKIIYVLTNTPEHIIINEQNKQIRMAGFPEDDEKGISELCTQVRANHTYNDFVLGDRVSIYEVKRDEKAINQIKDRVDAIREFILKNNMK